MTVIRFRRGEKINLPESAPSGTPLWCEDTKELYIGTSDSVVPIAQKISDQKGFVNYSVNSGNVDSNGYADLIEKVSDTEVAFKVGGIYPNMGVTFPNSKFYEISSISNITGLIADGIYNFILFEDNLTELEDGTYSATVNALITGYTSYDNLVPIMASPEQYGFTVGVFNPNNNAAFSNPHALFDRNNSTGITFSWGWGNGIYATLSYVSPIKMTKCQFYAPTSSGSLSGIVTIKAYGSNDGVNWTEVLNTGDMRSTGNINSAPTFNCHSPGYFTHYKFQVVVVNLVGGYSGTTSNIRTINPYYDQEFTGGNITEEIILPESPENGDLAVLTSQIPLKPYIRQSSEWIEKQFIKIGNVQKLSGLMQSPLSREFNLSVSTFKKELNIANNTIYKAESDGFITVYAGSPTSPGPIHLHVYTGKNNPPENNVVNYSLDQDHTGTRASAFAFVRAGEHFKVYSNFALKWARFVQI